jgi:hypothetical protein
MNDFKKVFLISFILEKSNIVRKDIIQDIYDCKKEKFFTILIVLNCFTFFGTISDNFREKLLSSSSAKELIDDFSPIRDLKLTRLKNKKDVNFVLKLLNQEIISFALFFENYMLFDLPVTLENIEFFKRDKNPKIYRYKNRISFNGKIYSLKKILNSKKSYLVEKEYRIEKEILFG